MAQAPQDGLPTIYPYFGYRDAAFALHWLAEAFGFEKTVEIPGPDGAILHAEMRLGHSMMSSPGKPKKMRLLRTVSMSMWRMWMHTTSARRLPERALFMDRKTLSLAHVGTGRWTLKVMSGASEPIDRQRVR
jgi:hypothetical protein